MNENFDLLFKAIEKDERPFTTLHYSFDVNVPEEEVNKFIEAMTEAQSRGEKYLNKQKLHWSGYRSFTSRSNDAARNIDKG